MSAFTSLGADSNAFTSFTKTNYLFSATDHFLDNLDLLDELVTSAQFTEDSILIIALQERKQIQAISSILQNIFSRLSKEIESSFSKFCINFCKVSIEHPFAPY